MTGLQWVRFDTALPDHPKILALLEGRNGHRSAFVFVCSLAYSGRHGTDGYIPAAALGRINGCKADADSLVRVGLWDADLEGGWHVHDWADYQQTADATAEVREKRHRASIKANCVRHHGDGCGCWQTVPTYPRAVR